MSVSIRCSTSPVLSPEQLALLGEIQANGHYVVANFQLLSSRDDSIYTGALENVHLLSRDEAMGPVVERGELLQQLAELGLIILNYHLPAYVQKDYLLFRESALWQQLEEAVAEAKEQNYTFDILHMEKGLAALTVKGKYALRKAAEH